MPLKVPKISVCMITYNHEKYIAQAIESVLMQRTNFDYELIIGEDDSDDRTREIVLSYAERHPEKIRPLLNDRANVIYVNGRPTGRWNLVNTMKQAKGEYIALLEGDDYWTDPNKLQKQVDFLESHGEYVICFHNVLISFEDIKKPTRLREKGRFIWNTYTIEEIIINSVKVRLTPPGHTSSAVFRNIMIGNFPAWFFDSLSGDIPLFILINDLGLSKYLNEKMGVHRIHAGGVSQKPSRTEVFNNQISMYESLNRHFNYKYDHLIRSNISRIYVYLALLHKKNGEKKLFYKVLFNATLNDIRTLIYYCETSIIYKKISSYSNQATYIFKSEGVLGLISHVYNFLLRLNPNKKRNGQRKQ